VQVGITEVRVFDEHLSTQTGACITVVDDRMLHMYLPFACLRSAIFRCLCSHDLEQT
jgi:hypothetical protein